MQQWDSNLSISRRTYLGGLTGSALLGSLGAQKASSQQIDSTENLFVEPAPISEDPYIVVAHGAPYFRNRPNYGWEPQPREEQLRTILGLNPDLLDFRRLLWLQGSGVSFPGGVQNQLDFALDTGYPANSGQTLYVSANDTEAKEHYDKLLEEEGWTFPNGESVTSPVQLVGKSFYGDPHGWGVQGSGITVPSVFAPGSLDIQTAEASGAFDGGFSGMFLDSTTTPRVRGLDFSRWAIAAFKEHLSSLEASRLESLGIEDPATFNIKAYLEEHDITPGQPTDPRDDPVFREFHRFHHRGLKTFIEKYQSYLEEHYPERKAEGSAELFGNQFVGTEFNGGAPVVYLSDVLDFVNVEDNRTLPPEFVRDVAYKFFLAASRYEKPVLFEGQMQAITGNDSTRGLDPTKQFPTLQRLQIAEAYAMGAVRKLPLTGWGNVNEDETITHWIQPDGSIPNELQTFADFLHANRRFLKDSLPDNPVALVFSVPTALWTRIPQWDITSERHLESFRGAAKLLREAAIPYDVIMFGDPELYPDDNIEATLDSYETVVIPGMDCLTGPQREGIKTFLGNGGDLLISGEMPSRNEEYQPRNDVSSIQAHQGTTVLSENPARSRIDNPGAGSELIEAVSTSPIGLPEDASIGVNRLVENRTDRFQIHLINYDYDAEADSVKQHTEFDVTIPLPDLNWNPKSAQYHSPQGGRADLDVEVTDESVTVSIPELHEWGFIVIGADEEKLKSSVSQSTAKGAISDAKSAIESARSDDRTWSNEFVRATLKQDSAETLFEAGAYEDARDEANAAIEWADAAYGAPVVGIDQAHGQPTSQKETEPFSHLSESFPSYEFRLLDEWTEGTFSDLDVLLVPPALSFKGGRYRFTSNELDRLDSWVASGGSLATFARGGVASDIDDLTTRFGFKYQGENIVVEEGSYLVKPSQQLHALTRGLPAVNAKLGTPISTMPDNATVVVRTPSDTDAWLHRKGDLWSRESGEPSANDRAIYANAPYEDGLVTVSGIHYPLLHPNAARSPDLFMANLLETLSKQAKYSSRTVSAQATTTSEQRTTSPTTTRQNTEVASTTSEQRTTSPTTTRQNTEVASTTSEQRTTSPTTTRQNTEAASSTSNESNPSPTETTGTTTPGLGIMSTLSSLGGAAAVLKWYRSRNESNEE